jgi:hypothetical protein
MGVRGHRKLLAGTAPGKGRLTGFKKIEIFEVRGRIVLFHSRPARTPRIFSIDFSFDFDQYSAAARRIGAMPVFS